MPARYLEAVVTSKATRDNTQEPVVLCLFKADGTPFPIPTKQAAQADSTATDVAGLKTDFNALLAKLRLAGILT